MDFRSNRWFGKWPTGVLLGGCALALVLTGGCNSAAVAPHDGLLPADTSVAASQTAKVAMATSRVGRLILGFSGKSTTQDKTRYSVTLPDSGLVTGTVYLDFLLGGATGVSVPWDQADFARLYTAPDSALVITLGFGGRNLITFDIAASIDRANLTASLSSSGSFVAGPYRESFDFTDLVFTGLYPSGGVFSFNSEGHTVTVAFDGTNIAAMTDETGGNYTVNLDTGEFSAGP